MDSTDPILDALYAHNRPEPCLNPMCGLCALWDSSTTEEFVQDAIWVLPMITETVQ